MARRTIHGRRRQDRERGGILKELHEHSGGSGDARRNLSVPDASRGVVLFAHGSGSGPFHPRQYLVNGDAMFAA